MKSIIFHAGAEAEISEAAAYLDNRRKGLGAGLRRDLERALGKVGLHPDLSPRYEDTNYRFQVLRRFPYVVFFEVLTNQIEILAFAHARRRPGYWLERVRK